MVMRIKFSIYICIYMFIISLSMQLEYKKGHEERVSKYTTFADPPEVLLAKTQGQITSNVSFSSTVGDWLVAMCDWLIWVTGC